MSSQKPGYFWELERWKAEHGVSVRELALLARTSKTKIARLITGQFVHIDEKLKRDLAVATNNAIADPQWAAFTARRLAARMETAA